MNWPVLAGSLVAVLVMAGFSALLKLGGDARIDRKGVLELARAQNFDVAEIALDRAGLAALVRDAADRFLLIRRHGAHFVAQPVTPPLDARLDHRFLTLGKVTLDLGDQAGIWAANLRRCTG